jgi:2-polyprenyl-3-methyl-5-hydroxy-6-metoxy-1,4-benzoquinol methylase
MKPGRGSKAMTCPLSQMRPTRQFVKATTASAPPSELRDSAIEVRPLGFRVIVLPDLTEDVVRRSGIERGMGVLDFGCGAGHVSLWIAKLVGPTGLVVGVDESAEVIDVAQRRATVAGQCYWTRFVTADRNTLVPHDRFDAVVVRLTLLRQDERATFLRLSACVRPGGVIMVVSGKPAGNANSSLHRIGSLLSWGAGQRAAWRSNVCFGRRLMDIYWRQSDAKDH